MIMKTFIFLSLILQSLSSTTFSQAESTESTESTKTSTKTTTITTTKKPENNSSNETTKLVLAILLPLLFVILIVTAVIVIYFYLKKKNARKKDKKTIYRPGITVEDIHVINVDNNTEIPSKTATQTHMNDTSGNVNAAYIDIDDDFYDEFADERTYEAVEEYIDEAVKNLGKAATLTNSSVNNLKPVEKEMFKHAKEIIDRKLDTLPRQDQNDDIYMNSNELNAVDSFDDEVESNQAHDVKVMTRKNLAHKDINHNQIKTELLNQVKNELERLFSNKARFNNKT